jgi:CheY-like chemotaxis protein
MIINDVPWSALVIDDDPGIRQSLRLCLEAAGYTYAEVSCDD